MRAPWRTAAGLGVAVALLAGCSSDETAAAPDGLIEPLHTITLSTATLPPAAPALTPDATPAPIPEVVSTPMDFDPTDDVEAYPVWDQASREQAVAAATAAMTAFARPPQGSDPQAWWANLAPLLTPPAQATYASVDPAEVPPTRISGPAVLVEPEPGDTAFLATVHVPTDAGRYALLLARTGHDAPWLAEQITPPSELSGPVTAPQQPPTPAPTPAPTLAPT